MSGKFPSLGSDDVVRLLVEHGYVAARQRGSHLILYHPTEKKRATVPMGRKDLPPGTLRSILRAAGISREEVS